MLKERKIKLFIKWIPYTYQNWWRWYSDFAHQTEVFELEKFIFDWAVDTFSYFTFIESDIVWFKFENSPAAIDNLFRFLKSSASDKKLPIDKRRKDYVTPRQTTTSPPPSLQALRHLWKVPDEFFLLDTEYCNLTE